MTQRRIYQDDYPYFITWRTLKGYPLFNQIKYAELLSKIIIETGSLKKYNILSYQIMPDHIHLLVDRMRTAPTAWCGGKRDIIPRAQPAVVARPSGSFTISELLHGIKSYYSNQIRDKYNINYPIFQKRFYTRIVNNRMYLNNIIQYIKNNPIKKGLPNKYHNMPYQYFNWRLINK